MLTQHRVGQIYLMQVSPFLNDAVAYNRLLDRRIPLNRYMRSDNRIFQDYAFTDKARGNNYGIFDSSRFRD
ncbi:hypothetical protein D3C80_2152100 [compost metagenome]